MTYPDGLSEESLEKEVCTEFIELPGDGEMLRDWITGSCYCLLA